MDHNGFHSAVSHACNHVLMAVRPMTAEDLEQCQAIVRGLPDYFTDDVPQKVERDLDAHQGWVVTENESVVGFAIVDRRSHLAAEVLWIAVRADRRHSGLGTTLLDHVLQALGADGVRLVEAKTLDGSANYAPYVATRSFWERHGFVHVDTIDPLPGWRPGNPAAIYVCALGPTR
jgi:ribosomal protein S18 acetylase RimI-like enzyme